MDYELTLKVAANGAVLASMTSALVNLPFIARVGALPRLTAALVKALIAVCILGVAGAVAQSFLH